MDKNSLLGGFLLLYSHFLPLLMYMCTFPDSCFSWSPPLPALAWLLTIFPKCLQSIRWTRSPIVLLSPHSIFGTSETVGFPDGLHPQRSLGQAQFQTDLFWQWPGVFLNTGKFSVCPPASRLFSLPFPPTLTAHKHCSSIHGHVLLVNRLLGLFMFLFLWCMRKYGAVGEEKFPFSPSRCFDCTSNQIYIRQI